MPKDTFFNLPEDKRNRIIEASMDEFSANSYEVSSINQIVKNSNIAKGSFYQYFENKEDLYQMIIELCGDIKNEYISRVLNRAEYMNFFDKLTELYKSIISFSEDNERVSSIITHLYRIDDIEFRNELIEASGISSMKLFDEIVEQGQSEGEIKKSMDSSFLSAFLYDVSMFIIEYREGQGKLFNYEDMINTVVGVLKSGMKPGKRNKGFMNLL